MSDNREEHEEKVIARELAKLEREDQKAAAGEIVRQHRQFEALLPAAVRENIEYFILSAVKYVRRHIDDPFTPESFVDAVFDGARYGLAIDGRLAHALPFADKEKDGVKNLVFVPDYKGMICVAKQRGVVRDVRSYVVYEGDEFEPPGESAEGGVTWNYRAAARDRGKPIGAICVLEFCEGPKHLEWMDEADIAKVRASAKTQKIWEKWPDEMRKKTVIRRGFKIHQDDPVLSQLLADDAAQYDDNKVLDVTPKRARTLTLPKVGEPSLKARAKEAREAESTEPNSPEVVESAESAGESTYQELLGYCHSHDIPPKGWKPDDEKILSAEETEERCAQMHEALEAL